MSSARYNNMTATEHWELFPKFCHAEISTGGPDPQLEILAKMAQLQGLTNIQRIWLAGCYGAHHCVPSAWAVFQMWPDPKDVEKHGTKFWNFLQSEWDNLPVRNEMRSHRMLHKRHQCLIDFAWLAIRGKCHEYDSYHEGWEHSQASVKYFGRYMCIKFLETLYRMDINRTLELNDIRAKGGKYPRRTLAKLFPGNQHIQDADDDSAVACLEADYAGARVIAKFILEPFEPLLANMTWFQLQVLLCEYREAINGTFYPGASLDEQLEFTLLVEDHGYDMSALWEARSELFADEHRGEVGGWTKRRPELFREFGGK